MAKRKKQRTARKSELHPFDVYAQEDGALAVLPAGDDPEYDATVVEQGIMAVDERDAVAKTRASNRKYRKAAAANPDHEPNMPDDPRLLAEQVTNRRLGITTRPARKRKATKKRAVKSTTRKSKSGKKRASTKRTTRR